MTTPSFPSNGTPQSLPPKAPPPNSTSGVTQTEIPLEAGKTVQYVNSNISIEFKTTNSSVSIRDRIVSLFATLHSVDDTFQLFPIDPTSKLVSLSKSAEFPKDLKGYVSDEQKLRNGTKYHINVRSLWRINRLKNHRRVMNHLQKHDIWMKYNTINSVNITATSWLSREDPNAVCRHELHKKMVAALDGKFTRFQLNARNVTFKGADLKTRAWVLEMDREDAKIWTKPLHQAFPFRKDKTSIQLIPFSTASYAREEAIKKVFYLQNHFLKTNVVIRIDNLRGLDAPMTLATGDTTPTLRQSFENVRISDESDEKLFTSVCQYNSGRVTLCCKKKHLEIAIQSTDQILESWIPTQLNPASIAQVTFPDKPPIRIGKPIIDEEVETFEQEMRDLQLEFDLDDASVISELKSAAPRSSGLSYASVTSGITPPASTTTKDKSKQQSTDASLAATTTSEMDAFFESIQKRTDALQQSNEATSSKVDGMEITMQKTLKAVEVLTSALETQAQTLSKITRQLEQMTGPSPPDSPLRKRQATESNKERPTTATDIGKLTFDLTMATVAEEEATTNTGIESIDDSDLDSAALYADNDPPEEMDDLNTKPPADPPPRK